MFKKIIDLSKFTLFDKMIMIILVVAVLGVIISKQVEGMSEISAYDYKYLSHLVTEKPKFKEVFTEFIESDEKITNKQYWKILAEISHLERQAIETKSVCIKSKLFSELGYENDEACSDQSGEISAYEYGAVSKIFVLMPELKSKNKDVFEDGVITNDEYDRLLSQAEEIKAANAVKNLGEAKKAIFEN